MRIQAAASIRALATQKPSTMQLGGPGSGRHPEGGSKDKWKGSGSFGGYHQLLTKYGYKHTGNGPLSNGASHSYEHATGGNVIVSHDKHGGNVHYFHSTGQDDWPKGGKSLGDLHNRLASVHGPGQQQLKRAGKMWHKLTS